MRSPIEAGNSVRVSAASLESIEHPRDGGTIQGTGWRNGQGRVKLFVELLSATAGRFDHGGNSWFMKPGANLPSGLFQSGCTGGVPNLKANRC
jgi:hypothetical protein